MAVFTPVTDTALNAWLSDYALGDVRDLTGIASGVENTNYFLSTTCGEYVLTLFEKLRPDELPFFLGLMQHLAAHGIPVPAPIARLDGTLFGELEGKPAAIVRRLAGNAQLDPVPHHCAEVGAMLAHSHLAAQTFALRQPNLRSLDWWQQVTPTLLPHLPDDQSCLLQGELAHQSAFFASTDYRALPGGPCHCDLFRDNALFVADPGGRVELDRLGGFFDYYFAGDDKWLFDLAVTANDWCVDPETARFDAPRLDAMLDAYESIRPLSILERDAWHDMLRAAALRFWVSRLNDFHRPRDAAVLTVHDPGHFERMLRERIDSAMMR